MITETEPGQKIFTLPVPFTHSFGRKLFSIVRNPLEKMLLLNQLNRIYAQVVQGKDGSHFLERALEALDVGCVVSGSDLLSVPQQGPVVVVANHPFGGIEGIILASVIRRVRPDIKILANHLLYCIPDMGDLLIYVDPFDGKDAILKNLKPLREAIAWLREGHVLAVFPAGTVSHLHVRELQISDPRWYGAVARIVQRTHAPVLPVFFDGANSAIFHLAGIAHPKLRTALLPHELLNKSKRQVRVRIGNVIPYKKLENIRQRRKVTFIPSSQDLSAETREQQCSTKGDLMFQRKEETRDVEPVVSRTDPKLVAEEVKRLPPGQCLFESGNYAVMHARAHQIPNLLYEIGRQREISLPRGR